MLLCEIYMCAGTVKYEEDMDREKPNSDRLVECDPLLVPVLDPFVAVSLKELLPWAHISTMHNSQVPCP